jgi:hypothetical protein
MKKLKDVLLYCKVATLVLIGLLIFITIFYRCVGKYWITKAVFAKEIKTDSTCYIRIDKHFTIYPESDKYVLYENNKKTEYCILMEDVSSKFYLATTLLDEYYSKYRLYE